MGIENPCGRALLAGALFEAHYPSWGSKTGVRRRSCPRQQTLITPHGDRKRAARGPGLPAARGSLPLMGIENGPVPLRQRPWRRLITPHGDRKPAAPASSNPAICSSLPLMGIENGHRRNPGRESSLLITPHGDRKLQRTRLAHDPTGTLITPHGDRKPRWTRHIAKARRSHYPSWGSKTCDIRDEEQQLDKLITPHGDRKRATSSCRSAGHPISLPLMGIENIGERDG